MLDALSPGQLIVASFAALILLGSLVLWLPLASSGQQLTYLEALFTATSAVCVTGLVVVDTGTGLSGFGQAVVLLLIQVGGFGVLTAGTLLAFATGRRIGLGERLRIQQQLNANEVGGIVGLVQRIAAIVVLAELGGALLLFVRFAEDEGPLRGAWFALFHSISAFNNAGFALHADSLSRYLGDPLINGVVITLIVVGGLGFIVLLDLGRGFRTGAQRHRLSLHTKLVLTSTAVLIGVALVAIIVFEWDNPATLGPHGTFTKLQGALFAAVTPRTAGFNTIDYGAMQPASLLLTMLLMFIGGSPGSTAGGIKTVTFWVMAISIWSVLRGRPDAVAYERRLSASTVVRAGAIAFGAIMVGGAALTVMSFTEPEVDFLSLMFEAVSALGTAGLSMGATSDIGDAGRVILIALMFLGRIGFLTFALALVQRRPGRGVHMLDEEVVIG